MARSPESDRAPRVLVLLLSFLRTESASAAALLAATAAALLWANLGAPGAYDAWWRATSGAAHGLSARFVVNDVLMAMFFVVVGLEIAHEWRAGALATARQRTLPVLAALGGMALPAALYLVFAHAPPLRVGWGVPMATDIAFALGALALLGARVPLSLRVLLLAFAIVDDLGAVLVIALFYTDVGSLAALLSGLALVAAAILLGVRVRSDAVILAVAPAIWFGVHLLGVHAALSGCALAAVLHVRGQRDAAAARKLERAQGVLHGVAAWAAMPLFALANAGVEFDASALAGATAPLVLAIVVGLLVGKPLGIVGAVWLGVRLHLCALPAGVQWRGLWVIGTLGGIGFTMSTFVATLAFADASLVAAAQLGILIASAASALLGLLLGRCLLVAPRN